MQRDELIIDLACSQVIRSRLHSHEGHSVSMKRWDNGQSSEILLEDNPVIQIRVIHVFGDAYLAAH